MTRLEQFAAELTREMLLMWHGAQPTEHGVALIAERRIREFAREAYRQCCDGNDGSGVDAYLDEPAPRELLERTR